MYWSVSQNQRKSYEKHGISKYSKIRTGDLDMVISTWFLLYLLLLKFFFCFLFLLYFTLQSCMVLPYIDMNPHGCTCVPKHEPPSHLPSHNISLGHHCAPAPSMRYPASDIDWRFDSYMIVRILHVTIPFSQIIPPSPSPSESKSPLYTSVSFLLFCIQGRHCHLSKFHIYVLVYCIGVFLSGLLHSV